MTAEKSEEYQALEGGIIKLSFTNPNKGRINLNFLSKNNDNLMHMSIRFDWYTWKKVLVLNSRKAGKPWGKEEHLKGFPFTPNEIVHVNIEITKNGYHISANNKKIGEYPGILLPVDKVNFNFEDTGASIKAKFISFEVEY